MFLISFLIVFYILVVYLTKNTMLSISVSEKRFSGIFFQKEMMFILLGLWTYLSGLYRDYPVFYVADADVIYTSMWIVFSLVAFIVSLKILLSLSNWPKIRSLGQAEDNITVKKRLMAQSFVLLFLLSATLLFMTTLGYRHAFLTSILSGQFDLLAIRLNNNHDTGVPTFVRTFYYVMIIMFALWSGMLFSYHNPVTRLLYIVAIVFFAATFGNKGIPIHSLVIYFAGMASCHTGSLNKLFTRAAIAILMIIGLIVLSLRLQFGENAPEIISFLLYRIGYGQLGGAFEQFSLGLNDPSYALHAIPFSRFFVSYTPFNKDIMMHMYGQFGDPTATGVANSYFLGEALAIGGKILVFFAPFIMALYFVTSLFVFHFIFNRLLLIPNVRAVYICEILVVALNPLSADFAPYIVGKWLIMIIIFTLPFIITYRCLRLR